MLPVTTGFIFPDKTVLETGGIGHRKMAFRYIVQNGLLEEYNNFEQDGKGREDEFLIDVLGAAKVYHCNCQHFICVPRIHGEYIEEVKNMYKEDKKRKFNVEYYYKGHIYSDYASK